MFDTHITHTQEPRMYSSALSHPICVCISQCLSMQTPKLKPVHVRQVKTWRPIMDFTCYLRPQQREKVQGKPFSPNSSTRAMNLLMTKCARLTMQEDPAISETVSLFVSLFLSDNLLFISVSSRCLCPFVQFLAVPLTSQLTYKMVDRRPE